MAAKQRAAGSPGASAAQEAAAAQAPNLPVAMAAKQRAAANAEAAAAAKSTGPGGGKKPGPPPPPPVVKKPRRVRLPVPGVADPELVSHPWFAAHAAAGQMPKPPAGQGTDAPAAPGDDDVWYAGRCYALLDLIEKQRVITRRMAASMCQVSIFCCTWLDTGLACLLICAVIKHARRHHWLCKCARITGCTALSTPILAT